MTFIGWGGGDPPSVADPADYELGTRFIANADITVTHARVYGAADAGNFSGRRARLWSAAGSLLTTAILPDTLLPGWNLYEFATPIDITSGTTFVVSYSVIGGYGAGVHALDTDVTSPNGDVTCPGTGGNGVLNFTPAQFPSAASGNSSFFGIDIGFDEAGSTAPVISSIDTDVSNLTVSATANVTDAETLTGATYVFDWGDGTETTQGESEASHTYASAGLYALLVIVTDASGLSDSMAVPYVLTAPTAPGSLLANNDLVARAWVASVTGLPANKVGLKLPEQSAWAGTGFVHIVPIGGSPDPEIPERAPTVEINCYAANVGSSKPPWNLASQLAEIIVAESYRRDAAARVVNPGTNYKLALVQSATVVSEPRRVASDTGSYARISFDLVLRWRHAS